MTINSNDNKSIKTHLQIFFNVVEAEHNVFATPLHFNVGESREAEIDAEVVETAPVDREAAQGQTATLGGLKGLIINYYS